MTPQEGDHAESRPRDSVSVSVVENILTVPTACEGAFRLKIQMLDASSHEILAPCPYCGSHEVGLGLNDIVYTFWVSCPQCYAIGPSCDGLGDPDANRAEAITRWNAVAGPLALLRKRIMEARKALQAIQPGAHITLTGTNFHDGEYRVVGPGPGGLVVEPLLAKEE